jgi:hypothetical protein
MSREAKVGLFSFSGIGIIVKISSVVLAYHQQTSFTSGTTRTPSRKLKEGIEDNLDNS